MGDNMGTYSSMYFKKRKIRKKIWFLSPCTSDIFLFI